MSVEKIFLNVQKGEREREERGGITCPIATLQSRVLVALHAE